MKFYLLILSLALFNLSYAQNLRSKLQIATTDTLEVSNTSQTDIKPPNDTLSTDDAIEEPTTDSIVTEETNTSPENTTNIDTTLPDLSDWTQVDLNQAHNDTVFMSAFNFGLSYVLAQGIQATLLQDTTYNVSQVFSVHQQIDGFNYKVDCQVTVDGFDIAVNVSFTTFYQPDTNSREIIDFKYSYLLLSEDNLQNIVQVIWSKETDIYTVSVTSISNFNKTEDEAPNQTHELDQAGYLSLGGYSQIPVETINNNEMLSNLLIFGAAYINEQGIASGYLNTPATGSYNLVQILSIHGQQNTEGTVFYFRFEVLIDNGAGSTGNVNYEVFYDSSASSPQVASYAFKSIINV